MGLTVGVLLLLLGSVIGIVCLLLPLLTNDRISFKETLFGLIPAGVFFLLGFIFTILALIFTARAKKVADVYRTQLQPEGIIFFEEDLKGSMTFRNFSSPGRYDSWRKVAIAALLALTNKRILALKGSSPIVDVPLTDERLKKMKFSVEDENKLCIAFDANLFHNDWSGEIEYRFKTQKANEYLRKISELTN